jgi:hypothetical protein
MSPNFAAIQQQIDITFLIEKLVTIGTKVPTTPKGGNHGHTNTNTPQPSKTPSHTAEPRAENSRKISNTPKPRVETTITPQPIKIPSNTAEPRVENLRTKGGNHQEPRSESQELRSKSWEPKAESQEPRTKSQEHRAKSQEPRAKSREPRCQETKCRESRAKSQEPRAEDGEPRDKAESQEPRAKRREPRGAKKPSPKEEPHSHGEAHSKEGGQGQKRACAQDGEGGAHQSQEGACSQEDCAHVGVDTANLIFDLPNLDETQDDEEGPDHQKSPGFQEGSVRGRCPFFWRW